MEGDNQFMIAQSSYNEIFGRYIYLQIFTFIDCLTRWGTCRFSRALFFLYPTDRSPCCALKKTKKKKNKSSRQCRGRTAGVCKPSAPEVVATVCCCVQKNRRISSLSLFFEGNNKKGRKNRGGTTVCRWTTLNNKKYIKNQDSSTGHTMNRVVGASLVSFSYINGSDCLPGQFFWHSRWPAAAVCQVCVCVVKCQCVCAHRRFLRRQSNNARCLLAAGFHVYVTSG